jgi:serine/threonine protein kinase
MLELDPGQVLEGLKHTYLIEAEQGRGGFGITWKASDEDGKLVVVKQLRLDKVDSWKTLELFHREAEVLESLNHPQIPDYVEFFALADGKAIPIEPGAENSGALFLVQRFIEGKTLAQLRAEKTHLEPAEIRSILRQSLEVLAYLHELSPPVTHRDIHPKNLIFGPDSKVYLIDFGAMQDRLRFGDEMGSTTVGTFGFIPLEQSMGRAQPVSDLYALAMTILNLVSGRAPHELPVDEMTGKVKVAEVVSDSALRGVLDAMAEPIVGQRIKSARSALEALDNPTALVKAPVGALVRPEPTASITARRIYRVLAGSSISGAVLTYAIFFNDLSETQLVALAPFWVYPMVIGLSGIISERRPKPYQALVVYSVVAIAAFNFFLYGIFPGL